VKLTAQPHGGLLELYAIGLVGGGQAFEPLGDLNDQAAKPGRLVDLVVAHQLTIYENKTKVGLQSGPRRPLSQRPLARCLPPPGARRTKADTSEHQRTQAERK
jgi:hypothetical protein